MTPTHTDVDTTFYSYKISKFVDLYTKSFKRIHLNQLEKRMCPCLFCERSSWLWCAWPGCLLVTAVCTQTHAVIWPSQRPPTARGWPDPASRGRGTRSRQPRPGLWQLKSVDTGHQATIYLVRKFFCGSPRWEQGPDLTAAQTRWCPVFVILIYIELAKMRHGNWNRDCFGIPRADFKIRWNRPPALR